MRQLETSDLEMARYLVILRNYVNVLYMVIVLCCCLLYMSVSMTHILLV